MKNERAVWEFRSEDFGSGWNPFADFDGVEHPSVYLERARKDWMWP
jgi:hypothetical protein